MRDIDLDDYFARQSGQVKRFHGANIKFEYCWIPDEKESIKEGRPIFREMLQLSVHFPGADITVREVEERDKFEYKEIYEAFLLRESEPTEGTPLSEWTLMPRGIVEELKHFLIKTVEQLATYPVKEDPRQVFITKWQKRARKYLESAKDAKNQVVALSELNEKLEAKNAKYEQQVLLLLQRIEASEGVKLTNGANGFNI